jgi:Arc/MetJ-type ribon-helix-helix transcriptional regulator
MSTTVTLSPYASQLVQARIDAGDFPDALSVIEAALHDTEKDHEIEQWLTDVVAPTYDALEAGDMKTYSSEEVRAHMAKIIADHASKTIAA